MTNKQENENTSTQARNVRPRVAETFPELKTYPSGWDMSELMAVYNQSPPPASAMGEDEPSTLNTPPA